MEQRLAEDSEKKSKKYKRDKKHKKKSASVCVGFKFSAGLFDVEN